MEDLGQILSLLRERAKSKQRCNEPPRQALLVSATLSEGVESLAKLSLVDPLTISANKQEEKPQGAPSENTLATIQTPQQLSQNYVIVGAKQRLIVLAATLRRCIATKSNKTVVFMLSCASVEFHHWLLSNTVIIPSPGINSHVCCSGCRVAALTLNR